MNQNAILLAAKNYAQQRHATDFTGHDFQHLSRVVRTAKRLQEKEGGDLFLIQLAAWLHDLEDEKLDEQGTFSLTNFFAVNKVAQDVQLRTRQIIVQVSYSGGFGAQADSQEAKIVQDADRLDAIGAIGIARTIAYGTAKKRKLYDYSVPYQEPQNKEAYRKSLAPTIHHFYHKLLRLKDKMHTPAARQMAEERHNFMLRFLEQFYAETRMEPYSVEHP